MQNLLTNVIKPDAVGDGPDTGLDAEQLDAAAIDKLDVSAADNASGGDNPPPEMPKSLSMDEALSLMQEVKGTSSAQVAMMRKNMERYNKISALQEELANLPKRSASYKIKSKRLAKLLRRIGR